MTSLLREFLRSPRTVGAIAPSSAALAKAMLDPLDLPDRASVLELGPGTGPFTAHIERLLGPWSRYLGVEVNPAFVALLRRRHPALEFAQASVEHLDHLLEERNWTRIDAVICSLPWASLPVSLQDRVFATLRRLSPPGAVFATYAYVQGMALPGGRALRRTLKAEFRSVTRSPIIWRNVPPAIAYICLR
jgi:phosphatidylethanolamine/phosphatidyl-N-methylethanolamine N-methyltransferase